MSLLDLTLLPGVAARMASDAKTILTKREPDVRTLVGLVVVLFCVIAPMDITHLVCTLLGAGGFLLLQTLRYSLDRRVAKVPVIKASPCGSTRAKLPVSARRSHPATSKNETISPMAKVEVRTLSAMPVKAPTFQAAGWEAEVEELLGKLLPTSKDDAAVAHIRQSVHAALSVEFPDVEVHSFASGSINNGAAFGVAVPDVEVVVSVDPEVLESRLQARWTKGGCPLDAKKLYKSALRVCTDRLVSTAAFKFRRSAFRGEEPKVTLLAPTQSDNGEQAVPVSLSVNAKTPIFAAALLEECSQKAPRAKSLILLVRRWAKDRGLSHAAKGHLSPYTWTLLAVYFLQVGVGPLLPPLEGFDVSTHRGRGRKVSVGATATPPAADAVLSDESIGELLKAFFRFFAQEFDWRGEAVCPRLGRRAAPSSKLPLHIILQEDSGGGTDVGPSIEDPFWRTKNLGSCMTAHSFARLREEFQRADGICADIGSLTALLEPWAPAEPELPEKEDE